MPLWDASLSDYSDYTLAIYLLFMSKYIATSYDRIYEIVR